jgi:pyruvate kinase
MTAGSPSNLRAVLLDTQGPEIRLGGLAVCKGTKVPSENRKKKVKLVEGDELLLSTDPAVDGEGDASRMYVNYSKLPQLVKPGTKILLDDGLVMLDVLEVCSETTVRTKVLNSNELGERKSLCLPGTPTDLPAMSEKDKADIRYGVERDLDFIAASFVRKAADVHAVRDFAAQCQRESANADGRPPLVISKVETLEAMQNWREILDASDGVMVARGDLGVEMALEEVTLAQKMIIADCNAAGKPVIVATQMLDSMNGNPRPTRAEVSDVTNAVHDGADAVMLSGESANGKFPVQAIGTMREIIHRCETSSLYPLSLSASCQRLPTPSDDVDRRALEVLEKARADGVPAIIVDGPGASDFSKRISKFRPVVPVFARVSSPKEGRQLMLHRCIHPVMQASDVATTELAAELGYRSAHIVTA